MGHPTVNNDVDPHALANAQGLWNNFTTCMVYGVIGVATLLILLAVLFV